MDKQTDENAVETRGWRGPERRRHPRFSCTGAAEVVVNDAELLFRGQVRDLSISGCFVHSRARLRLRRNQEVDLYFTLGSEQVRCEARVMSVHAGKGVGFEFLPLTDRAQKSIYALICQLEEDARSGSVSATPAAT